MNFIFIKELQTNQPENPFQNQDLTKAESTKLLKKIFFELRPNKEIWKYNFSQRNKHLLLST